MNILLIEDDEVLANGLIHTLSDSGYRVTCAASGAYAEHLLRAQDFDLIVLDLGSRSSARKFDRYFFLER